MDDGVTGLARMRADYLANLRQRRLVGGGALILFAAQMALGFVLANAGHSGGVWRGLPHVFDFPGEILPEALRKAGELPHPPGHSLPALVETLNIAAIATRIGTLGGGLLSMLATPGLALWPRAIPVFRRLMDLCRAFPEIVVAPVLATLESTARGATVIGAIVVGR